jgi:pyruvate/2-oxoglutarate dehydrogenase complex dihydrolipoamide acyltransferase (E2) component
MQLNCELVASYTTGRIAMATKQATAKKAAKKTAAKRASKKSTGRKYSPSVGKDVEREMKEMKKGTLKSGRSGKKVTNPKQAIAIALSEARKEGKKVPPPPKKS